MISINLEKAKEVAHCARRRARSALFAPLDIKATIPTEAADAETARQHIRDRFASLQEQIDAAEYPDQLLPIMTDISIPPATA